MSDPEELELSCISCVLFLSDKCPKISSTMDLCYAFEDILDI